VLALGELIVDNKVFAAGGITPSGNANDSKENRLLYKVKGTH